MSEKTYVTPLVKEPEFVISPKGAINEQGVKQRRRAVKFNPNARGVGQFTTSDAKIQAFLDEHPWMASGKLVCVGAQSHMIKPEPQDEPEQKQVAGPATATPAVKKNKRK